MDTMLFQSSVNGTRELLEKFSLRIVDFIKVSLRKDFLQVALPRGKTGLES